ncbi:MAG: hypothetical protein HY332_04320 [Chloroflexi bacterium]|nr:hypothetical protein [Chloroflexota bacterium]
MLFALWWWLVVQGVAFCALPLSLTLFRPLADRGYGLSKAFGLLLFSYLVWLLAVTRLLDNGPIAHGVALCLVLGGSVLVWRRSGDTLRALWQRRRRLFLFEEALFLAAFLGFLWIRSYNADIAGTEKFMDFAFMNAVTRSTSFPPFDPWLAPSPPVPNPTINYYHFGYIVQGLLFQLTRVPPAVGFNLALGLLFAAAAAGAFSLGYSLARDLSGELTVGGRMTAAALPSPRRPIAPSPRRPIASSRPRALAPSWSLKVAWPYAAAGILAAYMLLVAGNLWTALRRFDGSGMWQKDFWQGIGWNATRVLVIKEGDKDLDYTINEFPAFSFLLGDMHPHVLALPFVLVAIGVAYTWLMRPPRLYLWVFGGGQGPGVSLRGAAELLPGALVLGSLYFLNSWDFPAYFVLAQAAALAGAWWWKRQEARGKRQASGDEDDGEAAEQAGGFSWERAGVVLALIAVVCVALFLPFHLTFKLPVVADGGSRVPLGLVTQRSLLGQFLQFWGAQLLLLAPAIAVALGGVPLARRSLAGSFARARALAVVAREVPGWEPALLIGGVALLMLVAERFGAGVLVLTLLLAAGAALAARRALEPGAGGRPLAFAFGVLGLAFLLLAACEVVYIRDFYGGALRRMNTVFKFYYQAWLLMAVGGSAAAFWLARRLWLRRNEPLGRAQLWAFGGSVLLLFGASLHFPYKATLLRTNTFQNASTLDGMDWMRRFHPDDHAAAQWLREHATGRTVAPNDNAARAPLRGPATTGRTTAPVIVEATGGAYSEYARIATQTGFPTILGWDQHERLWRGAGINAEVEARKNEVDAIYTAATPAQVQSLLEKYNVSYLVLGYLEQQEYGGPSPEGQRQFAARIDALASAAGWDPVFRQGQTTIYKVAK